MNQPERAFRQEYHRADVQCARHHEYWVKKLAHLSVTPLPLPTGLSQERKKEIASIDVVLNPAAEAAFATRTSTASRTDWLLTAWLLTVARLSGHQSVGVGYQSLVSSQIAADTAGLFTNWVPFSVRFDWEAGFDQAVAALLDEQTAVEQHLTFPHELLVSHPALHDTARALNEQGFPIHIYRMGNDATAPMPEKALVIVVTDENTCRIVFNTVVWEPRLVDDLVNRWLILLDNLVAQPAQPLKVVHLLTTDEQRRMLVDWNATAVPYPREQAIHHLVEAQVRQRPQAEALRYGTDSLTYEQLNQRANQLAWYLRKQGVGPDTLVGLCLERSPEMIITLLAILKAGGAYVPLDPAYPVARLEELQRQTGVRFIITWQKWLDRLPPGGTYILLDDAHITWANESTQNPDASVTADQLAYVLFTSGSTGQSKGVAIPHRGVVRLVRGANYMRLDNTVVMLGLAPLAFDASTLEIWGPLANGGRLVLMAESHPSLDAIKQTIQNQAVNTTFITAALFNVLVDSGITALTTLTQLVTGGEAASAEHVWRARHQLPACTLINGYGPTESTTLASFYNLSASVWETSSVPIGTPVSNTQVYIVDSCLHPVPVGWPGELLIGGDGLAREYIHQPELTRQKFIPDPFSAVPGSRLYRTGDQARYLSDGTIEFLGRLDDQLKIRGFRIEPGEIEHTLCQHPTVGEAVVVAAESTPGHKALVAYLVAKPGAAILLNDLRTFLSARLPDHLIPAMLIPLEAMPLTANGKLDKSKLPPAFQAVQDSQNQAKTATEATILPVWAAVLSRPHVDPDDNFFELGGSSLLAMQLLARLNRQAGLLLTMKDVFEQPTVRQLSAYLDQNPQRNPTRISKRKATESADADLHFPLSSAQSRLWIIHQLYALQGTYNVPVVLKISGSLNVPVLQQALDAVVRRHQGLRTTFGHTNGLPFQQIAPAFSVPMLVSEVIAATNGELPDALAHWLKTEAYQPFDLEIGPLVRASIAHFGRDAWVVLLVFHHIIYDGWSTRVLAKEVSAYYTGLSQHRPVTLPELPIGWADYGQWQSQTASQESLQRERTYWKNRLHGAPILLNLPHDKPRPATQTFAGSDYSFRLPDELWQQIRYGLQEPGTTVFLRLLTVFAAWLHRVAHTNDVVLGIPVAGRNRPELEHLIGFFVNTLALRIEFSDHLTFRQLLRQVRQVALDAYSHQELPFEQVVEELKPPRNLAYSPLVQVFFDVQEDNTTDWHLDELHVESMPFVQHMAKFDLHLSFRETPEGMEGTFNYRSDLFTSPAIEAMARDFLGLMGELIARPDQPLVALHGEVSSQQSDFQPAVSSTSGVANRIRPEMSPQALDTALVTLLQAIWCWVLEVPTVGLDDDFFELGGHSLLAFQMTAELQRQTDFLLPVASVFANPTLRELATYLKTTHPDLVWHALVAVKPHGSRRPLFLVHPISGDIGYVYQIATYLPGDQPVYGLRAVGLDGVASPLASIKDMAAYYIQLLLEQQPNGPYALGGFSMGGIVAFEMARQLRQQGKEVSLLALIDSYPVTPNAHDPDQIPLHHLLRYYYHYWRSLPKRPILLWQIFRKKAPVAGRYFLNRFRQSSLHKEVVNISESAESISSDSQHVVITTNQRAYSTYTFAPYDGKVVLLRAAGEDGFIDSERTVDFGWKRYAQQGVDVHPIPGSHYTLFKNEAVIAQIAGILTAYLPT